MRFVRPFSLTVAIATVAATICVATLVHAQQPPRLMLSRLTWFDRSGKNLGTFGPLADHGNIELSPDGTRVASAVADRATGARDIWTYQTTDGRATQVTTSPADENWMVWSAAGSRAIVNAFGAGIADLFETPVGPGGARRQLATDNVARWPVSLSPDGRFLLCVTNSPRTGNDIWVVPMDGAPPFPFQRTEAAENWATFSPDGRFVAFSSTASGTAEVFVTPFPGPGPAWRVSDGHGTQTRWRRPGELVYLDLARRLTAVTLRVTDSRVDATQVTPLFEIALPYGAYHAFDVTADGQRVLVNTAVVSGQTPTSIAGATPNDDGRRAPRN